MVDYRETSTSRCEQFWFDVQFHSFWHVRFFHPWPPKLTIIQLEQQDVLTNVKVDYSLLFIALLNDLCREINCFVHFNTNLWLDSNLSRLVTAPTIQMPITQQRYWVTFTRLDFLDGEFLLFSQVMEVLVLFWDIVVLVLTITKCAVFTITEIIKIALRIDGSVELTASGYSLDFLAFKSSYLCWFKAGDIGTMAQRTSGVEEQVEEHPSVPTSIPKRINLPIFIQYKWMFLPTNCIFRLDIIFFKILNQLRCINLILMPKTTLPVIILTDGIHSPSITDDNGMIGTDCYLEGLFREVRLFRKGIVLPEEKFAGLEAESIEDFSC